MGRKKDSRSKGLEKGAEFENNSFLPFDMQTINQLVSWLWLMFIQDTRKYGHVYLILCDKEKKNKLQMQSKVQLLYINP